MIEDSAQRRAELIRSLRENSEEHAVYNRHELNRPPRDTAGTDGEETWPLLFLKIRVAVCVGLFLVFYLYSRFDGNYRDYTAERIVSEVVRDITTEDLVTQVNAWIYPEK